MIKNVSVNLPITDVLKGMPNYGGFMKEEVFNALADLGASINLMPHSLYERLGLGPLKLTRIRIRLANHSFDTAIGIAEDILVSIDSLVFPVDFVIMEMKEDLQVPLILGRPFLATADTIILVQRNQLNIGVGDERVTINIREAMKQPSNTDDEECYALDHIDLYVDEELEKLLGVDTSGFNQVFESDIVDLEADFNELMNVSVNDNELESETIREESFEAIPNEDRFRIKSSWEEPPTLELKELPEHLEYAFLKESGQLPVIISKRLTVGQKSKLVSLLRSHHKAIAWKTTDIPGINPSYRTHKILMEENYKPVVQRQRKLNPNMKEVVKKKVIKLLDTSLIYPISDSPWDFSKIARPMTKLLEKDQPFLFDDACIEAFNLLKEKLINPLILISPDWDKDFELMCDVSNYALGAVLGQRVDQHFRPIYYASKTLTGVQLNYTTTEKELLAVVFAFDKFRSYFVLSKTVVYTDHSALRDLFQKQDSKHRLIRWVLLLQEFGIEIKDKKEAENVAADHLSRLDNPGLQTLDESKIQDTFPDKHLMRIELIDEAEAKALPTNDARVVVKFLENLFARFGVPKALISD
ncbi:uncharacterized protein [Rutidosis leptorrhynchoides]|uniref:uncharacterized protein n=1 Tax=Rutidosis leptorrhynchoides TaxID=125765 RepID=UPI003A995DB5